MVHLMEIALLAEFVVGRFRVFCDDFGLVELAAEILEFLFELFVLDVDIWDLTHAIGGEFALLRKFVPLLLGGVGGEGVPGRLQGCGSFGF